MSMTPTPAACARARRSGSAPRAAPSTGSPFSNSPGCTSPSASTRSGPASPATVAPRPSTSSERVRAPRATGVIRGYHADIALEALGRRVQALIAVRIRPPSREHIEAFRDWAGALPETVGVFVVSGGDDFLLHVAVPDTDALYAFVIDRLTERREVADVRTSVVYEHIRRAVPRAARLGYPSLTTTAHVQYLRT